ncbi:MAG: hypothetical protein CXR31_03275 [Geobacter sp.]|nr:MAG: hypothetical protein CXR31_03275 [Geobacter sp.]
MGKKNKTRGLSVGGMFTPLRHEEHDSKAYMELTGNAAKLYGYMVRVARTVAIKLGATCEYTVIFDYTYTEAKNRGFSTSTFKRVIKELWQCGFINVVEIGGRTASKARGRMPSKYQLCKLWRTYGSEWRERTRFEADPWEHRAEPKKTEQARW